MPLLSRRFSSLAPSPTLALNSLAKKLASEGKKITNLTVGEPDFPTPQPIVDVAVKALHEGKTKYGASGGSLALRQAICRKLKRDNGLHYKPEEVVCGIGAKEILFHLSLALFEENDEMIVPAPYWVSYSAHCEAAGARAVAIPMSGSEPQLTPKAIEACVTNKTKAIMLNSPNNPAGYCVSKNQWAELGEYLAAKDWWIISDEIYEYLSFDHGFSNLLSVKPELRDRFVLVNGLSKGFAMTGWRVGYACAPESLIRVITNLQSQSSTCIPGFIEEAAAFALDQGPDLVRGDIESLKKRRDFAVAELKKICDAPFVFPAGAFYLFVDVRTALGTGKSLRDDQEFCKKMIEEDGVVTVPGSAFGAPGFIRMSFAVPQAAIVAGIQSIARCYKNAG